MLTRDQILSAKDIRTETVDVPEWGGEVMVRELDGRGRDAYDQRIIANKGKDDKVRMDGLRASLVALAVCDAELKPVFTEADIPALNAKSANAIRRVFEAAAALNGLADDSEAEASADFTPAPS
jgi:hypothetical protein